MTVCPDNTVDSNITGLAIAEEVCPGILPNMDDDGFLPTWYEAEPNSYPDNFGGTLKTVARSPIKANRQRSKGVTVDLDAGGGWTTDYTQNNVTRLLQGYFFADAREKATSAPLNSLTPAVLTDSSTDTITGTDLPRMRAGDIVVVTGSTLNDGVPNIVASSSDTELVGSSNFVDETFPADAAVSVVGKAFGAGAVAITVSADVGTIRLGTAPVAATAVYTQITAKPDDGETVTIGETTYTFRTAPAVAYDVLIGASITTAVQNLTAAINGATTLTPANPDVSAVDGGAGVTTVTARLKGTTENTIATTEVVANGSWNHATLTGGTGVSLLALGMIPGEWGFLGGDGALNHFANNIGYFRVGSINDQNIVMDRTSWNVEAEAAGAFTIQIFTGVLIQNENDPALIKKRSYQLQRTLGRDADGTQSQYVTGAVPNTLDLNVATADKLTVDLAYIAMGVEYRTGAQGLKAGTIFPAANEDAINTSNDIYEMAMSVIDETNSNPTRLFGYLSEAKLSINNNASIIKGVSKLGGIGVNVGIFEVSGTATAYFQNVAANIAITENADVDQHFIVAKHNAGFVYDIGLLTLGGGNIKIEANKPITIPLTTDAGQNKNGSTLTLTDFGYLPTLAMPEAA